MLLLFTTNIFPRHHPVRVFMSGITSQNPPPHPDVSTTWPSHMNGCSPKIYFGSEWKLHLLYVHRLSRHLPSLPRFTHLGLKWRVQHSKIIIINICLHFQKYIFGTIITSEGIHASMLYREYIVCNLWCSMFTIYGLYLADETSGGSTDYLMETAGMKYAFVTECRGNQFAEPPSQIAPSFAENWAGLVLMVDEMIRQAGD